MGFWVASDRNSVQGGFRGKKESMEWKCNQSEALSNAGSRGSDSDGPGTWSPSPPLFDSVLATFSCRFSLLGGKMAASSSQQPQQKKKKERTEGRKVSPLLTGQAEVPRLSLSGPVGVSAHLCACHCGHRGVLAQWTEGGGRMFPKENVRSVSRKKRAWY